MSVVKVLENFGGMELAGKGCVFHRVAEKTNVRDAGQRGMGLTPEGLSEAGKCVDDQFKKEATHLTP